MKHFGYKPLLSAITFALCLTAHAERDSGFYATATVGIGFLGQENLNYRNETINDSARGDFDASFAGGGSLGYRINENWRVETDLYYRRNDLNALTLDGIGASTEGDYASLSAGISALYDFRPFDNERLSVYVGAGFAFVQEIDIDFEVDGNEISFETDDVGLQLQFGGRYELSDRAYLDAGVRYLTLSGVEMTLPADATQILEADYSPLTLSIGAGWRF